MSIIRRQYHPLVTHALYAGFLSQEQLKLIPNSTLSYWHSFDHKELFGYEWVSNYIETEIQARNITKRKAGAKVIRFVAILSLLCVNWLWVILERNPYTLKEVILRERIIL